MCNVQFAKKVKDIFLLFEFTLILHFEFKLVPQMIAFSDVSIAFGSQVLFRSFSDTVAGGEMVCLTGASGRGKSSLLNAVAGIVPVAEGSISVDGIALSAETVHAVRRHVAWVTQEQALPCEDVYEMIHLPFTLRAAEGRKPDKGEILRLFGLLGLEHDLLGKKITEISGGQRQRINILTAVLLDRSVMLLDEPTSALDPTSIELVISLLQHEKRRGKTILAASHDATFIAACDRVINLDQLI